MPGSCVPVSMEQPCRASVLHGPKDLRLDERRLESPTPTELQIAIKATGLCGSDLHYYQHYRNGDIQVREPLCCRCSPAHCFLLLTCFEP